MPRRKPNWKYPCLSCGNCVRERTQNSVCCNKCKKWVHLKCTNLTWSQFAYISKNEKAPYFCVNCKSNGSSTPSSPVQPQTSQPPTPNNIIINQSTSSSDSSVLYEDDSDDYVSLTVIATHLIEALTLIVYLLKM